MKLNAIHRLVGIVAVAVFLLTGIHMRLNFPTLYAANEIIRYMYRANHVYILFAGLLNIALGSYLVLREDGWRRKLQIAGSLLILLSTALLIAAYFHEPPRSSPEKPMTTLGVLLMLGGTLSHMLGRRF